MLRRFWLTAVVKYLFAVALLLAAPLVLARPAPNPNPQAISYQPDFTFTLRTHIGAAGMGYQGVGGDIDGKINPTLRIPLGAVVQITLINGDGAEHDITVPQFDALSDHVLAKGASTIIVFRADKAGTFDYFCTLPGHRQAGMAGKLIVGKPVATEVPELRNDISRDPADVPPPVGNRAPTTVHYTIESFEVKARLADGTTYNYWTFNGKVPGPMLRVRVGDTVVVRFRNAASSRMIHSIDFHAVTGPGGGAAVLQVPPGGEKTLTFKALDPGLYVYHCATPMVAQHIANGMFGLILVVPAGGLPKVDHEYYVMQSEIYTVGAFGQQGYQEFDVRKLLDEQPEYFVFNGAVDALNKYHPLHSKTGDTVRIFFGDGGPNFTSSFHVIGEIFDRAYLLGSLLSPPLKDVQTITVPPGGAGMVEFTTEVPGKYILVDHALSRAERGLSGSLIVTGAERPDIYHGDTPAAEVVH
ncbi:MAG TPA: copper-containing nitrite reductase [Gammaproteobacteria bacterium]|nr:copper-containing nitrite reductase [Gammaproteobacteria bacterium]